MGTEPLPTIPLTLANRWLLQLVAQLFSTKTSTRTEDEDEMLMTRNNRWKREASSASPPRERAQVQFDHHVETHRRVRRPRPARPDRPRSPSGIGVVRLSSGIEVPRRWFYFPPVVSDCRS